MSLTKLTKDLSIISKLSDEPNDTDGLTADELKAKFDESGNSIKDYLNNTLTPELDSAIGESYKKPDTGIPKTDLASDVQTSLGKADTAYVKSDGGIPKADLDSDVQTSLGKADTALQAGALSDYRTAASQDVIDTGLNSALTTLNTQTNSAEWTPASGDTLLAFILANCTRTKLPFSFIKIGNNTVSDAPTAIQASEFAGTVYGSALRLTVQVRKYNNGDNSVYQRTIFESNWLGSVWTRYVNTEDLTQISGSSSILSTNDTYQIPSFGSHKVYTLIARRWGWIASSTVTKDHITDGLAGHITLNNTSGQGKNTELDISATGLITVSSTDDGVIIGVIASSPIA